MRTQIDVIQTDRPLHKLLSSGDSTESGHLEPGMYEHHRVSVHAQSRLGTLTSCMYSIDRHDDGLGIHIYTYTCTHMSTQVVPEPLYAPLYSRDIPPLPAYKLGEPLRLRAPSRRKTAGGHARGNRYTLGCIYPHRQWCA